MRNRAHDSPIEIDGYGKDNEESEDKEIGHVSQAYRTRDERQHNAKRIYREMQGNARKY